MKLELGSVILILSCPAQWPYPTGYGLSQASEKSASGIPHVEDFDVRTGIFTYHFSELSDVDNAAILDFFLNTAEGMMNNFYLTDDLNVKRLVHFNSAKIDFVQTYINQWSGSFTVEEII